MEYCIPKCNLFNFISSFSTNHFPQVDENTDPIFKKFDYKFYLAYRLFQRQQRHVAQTYFPVDLRINYC